MNIYEGMHLADVSVKTMSRKRQRHRSFQRLLCFEEKCGFWMHAEDIPALLEFFCSGSSS